MGAEHTTTADVVGQNACLSFRITFRWTRKNPEVSDPASIEATSRNVGYQPGLLWIQSSGVRSNTVDSTGLDQRDGASGFGAGLSGRFDHP